MNATDKTPMTARTELEALVAKWRDIANYVGDQNMLACADELESALSALTAHLGEAWPSGPTETPSVEADFGVLNRLCRHAFEIEDGYGDPDSNPKNFKVFRDGFFASYLMCGGNVENAVTWEISANCWREAFEEIYEFEVGQWEEVEAHARAALSTTPSPQREEGGAFKEHDTDCPKCGALVKVWLCKNCVDGWITDENKMRWSCPNCRPHATDTETI